MRARILRSLAAAALLHAAVLTAAVSAPEITLDARLDKSRAALGEPVLLTVIARGDEGVTWEQSSVADKLGKFEVTQVVGPGPLPPPKEGGKAEPGTMWVFRLAAFDLGKLDVPSFKIRYTPAEGGEPASVDTPELHVEIVSTVPEQENDPADVRHGFSLPPDILFWVLVAGGGILAALLVWLLARRLRRRPPAEAPPQAPGPPPRPAFDRFAEALEALLREGLLRAGRHKEFHVRISEIVKSYLGEVRGFDAVERTSWEVNAEMAASGAPEPLRAETRRFLEACDAVKFAKHVPSAEEAEATVAGARKIGDLARPRVAAPAESPDAAGGFSVAAGSGAAGARRVPATAKDASGGKP